MNTKAHYIIDHGDEGGVEPAGEDPLAAVGRMVFRRALVGRSNVLNRAPSLHVLQLAVCTKALHVPRQQ